MNDKVELVDYQEHLSVKVGRFLLSKEFDLASSDGYALGSPVKTDSLGLLRKDPEARPRTSMFGLIKREPRRMFLGTVWFSNSERDATEQNWVFEAYGHKYIELFRQLAEEMASTFKVKIALRLVREQPRVEPYYSDD